MDVVVTVRTKVEMIESRAMRAPKRKTLESIYAVKRDLISLRSIILPLKEIIALLRREATRIIRESTKTHLEELVDHLVQLSNIITRIESGLNSYRPASKCIVC